MSNEVMMEDFGEAAVEALSSAVQTGDFGALYSDQRALMGVHIPGSWAGEVERLMMECPHGHRGAIRRAAKATSAAVRAQTSSNRQAPERKLPLLLVHERTWFVLDGTEYLPVPKELVAVEISRRYPDLIPAAEAEALRPSKVFSDHGQLVGTIIYDMTRTVADWSAPTLRLPCAQLLPGVAEYSAAAEGYLMALGGEHYVRLMDWVFYAPMVSRPTAALYLEGPPSAGKGLLAEAIAQLWGGHKSKYDSVVLSAFNAGLRLSPMVFLDERASKDHNDRGSAGFRSMLGDSSHELTVKFLSATTIIGCPRLVICSNGPDALRLSKEDLGATDENAIGIRLLHIKTGWDAAEFLRRHGGREATEGWPTADGVLTRHLRWVIENWEASPPGSRLLVESSGVEWLKGAAHRDGLPRTVLTAVAQAAAGGDKRIPPDGDTPVLYSRGYALVSPSRLHKYWRELCDEDKRPSTNAIGRALARVSERKRVDGTWCYPVPAALLVEIAEVLCLDTDAITQRLGRDDAEDSGADSDFGEGKQAVEAD